MMDCPKRSLEPCLALWDSLNPFVVSRVVTDYGQELV